MKQTNKHQRSNALTTITRNCSIHCEVPYVERHQACNIS